MTQALGLMAMFFLAYGAISTAISAATTVAIAELLLSPAWEPILWVVVGLASFPVALLAMVLKTKTTDVLRRDLPDSVGLATYLLVPIILTILALRIDAFA
jgi:hypothetical protein